MKKGLEEQLLNTEIERMASKIMQNRNITVEKSDEELSPLGVEAETVEEAVVLHMDNPLPAKMLENVIKQRDYLITQLIDTRHELDGYTPGIQTIDEIEKEIYKELEEVV
tara:strand:- start:8509 stop:8838 length:330 start_codon:yes stop_codon:yes gene_type:complete